ncbi:hypothetical protein LUZ60_007193 [Juncus effusus]|nr:hypothetical protein LUZ60_007193 [Juncus effusus]
MMNRSNSGSKSSTVSSPTGKSQPDLDEKWEVRPGGMLVQKRDLEAGGGASPVRVPTIRVKVKYAGVCHEVYISSQATFGELKKAVSAKTGLHPDDQKIIYKDKERDSKAFLDTAGVKDRSKLVLLDDPEARARRLIELRKTEKADKAARAVVRIGLEVDRLATKVGALETIVNKGQKVVESDIIRLTELLMNELLKLDAIIAEGDVKSQRRLQVKRVQKYVETLDAIKSKNSAPIKTNPQPKQYHTNNKNSNLSPQPKPQYNNNNKNNINNKNKNITNNGSYNPFQNPNWEQFDLLSSMPSTSSATSATTVASIPPARYDWELF